MMLAALGFEVRVGKKSGLPYQIGDEGRPRSGRLIEEMLMEVHPTMGPFMWNHTSAVAHGALYAVLPMFQQEVDPFAPEKPAVRPSIRLGDVEWPCTVASMGHAEAFARMTQLYGWDRGYWADWKNTMGLKLIRHRKGYRDLD